MTPARKQELEKRAKKLYRLIWDSDLILSDLTDALEKVEREVWQKSAKEAPKHLTAEAFAKWCREQGGA